MSRRRIPPLVGLFSLEPCHSGQFKHSERGLPTSQLISIIPDCLIDFVSPAPLWRLRKSSTSGLNPDSVRTPPGRWGPIKHNANRLASKLVRTNPDSSPDTNLTQSDENTMKLQAFRTHPVWPLKLYVKGEGWGA